MEDIKFIFEANGMECSVQRRITEERKGLWINRWKTPVAKRQEDRESIERGMTSDEWEEN